MYNKVILAGNLSRDIEIRYSHGGSAIASTALAVNRKYKSSTGEQKEEVLFIDLAFYGRTAEVVNQYLHKGSKVLIDGRLKLDQWTDQQGQKQSKHKVDVESLQMLDNKDTGSTQQQAPQPQTKRAAPPQQQTAQTPQPQQNPPQFPEMSEEIPF
jgi:single-strand DNA-binding protein